MLRRFCPLLHSAANNNVTVGAELRNLVVGYKTNVSKVNKSLDMMRPILHAHALKGKDTLYHQIGGDVITPDVLDGSHLRSNLESYKNIFAAQGLDIKLQTDAAQTDFVQVSWSAEDPDGLSSFSSKDVTPELEQCFKKDLVEIEEIQTGDNGDEPVQLLSQNTSVLEIVLGNDGMAWLQACQDGLEPSSNPTTDESMMSVLEAAQIRVLRTVLQPDHYGQAVAKVVFRSATNKTFVIPFKCSTAFGLALHFKASVFVAAELCDTESQDL